MVDLCERYYHILKDFDILWLFLLFYLKYILISIVKVKESRNRPGVAQNVPVGLGSRFPRNSAHEGGEVVSLKHRPPLPPENMPGTHFH